MGVVASARKVMVLGKGGLLGSAISDNLVARGIDVLGLSRSDIDLEDDTLLAHRLEALAPDIVVNCAAHTNLEAAELDSSLDWQLNAVFPGQVAQICRASDIPMVHFSSTGCYGNWKDTPFTEADPLRPLSKHHRAKAFGEDRVLASGCRSAIFRLGWLYGGSIDQPKNFVWKRVVEASGQAEISSDDVQRGCPSFVNDVAEQVLSALDRNAFGVMNAVAEGGVTRCGYVRAIVEAAGLPCLVRAGPSFKRVAPVSPNEMAVNEKLLDLGLNIMPAWQDSLERYVRSLIAHSQM